MRDNLATGMALATLLLVVFIGCYKAYVWQDDSKRCVDAGGFSISAGSRENVCHIVVQGRSFNVPMSELGDSE